MAHRQKRDLENKMIKPIWYWIETCWTAAKRLITEGYTYHASALAFITLLALVPLLSVIVSLISIFPIFTKFIDLARHYIMTNFVPASSNIIEYYLENFTQQATSLPKIGIVFLFITTGILLITIEHTFNEIWQVTNNRNKYTSWLVYWLVLLLAPLLIGLSVFLSSFLFSLSWFSGTTTVLGINTSLVACVPILINTMIFSVIYTVIPRYSVKWRDGISGGFVTAILFEISKIGFAFYIKQFPHYEFIYGTLAAIPIFLIWIYIAWLIILYGALITHTQNQRRQTLS